MRGFIMLIAFAIWILAASVVTGILYLIDKRAARRHSYRISEGTLLFWSAIGGWPGAWFVGRRIRHKTHKRSYRFQFGICVVINVALVILLASKIA